MDSIEHIKACKQMLVELAAKVNLKVSIKETEKYPMIIFTDKDGYLIYNAYNCVGIAVGFINGIQSDYKFNP